MKTQTVVRSLAIAGVMLLIAFTYSFTLQKDISSIDNIKADITVDNYPSVIIGNQEWMTENLNTDVFRNGDPIPKAQSEAEWREAGASGKPAWCYYNNDPGNGILYGKLYNWYAVNDPRGLAPEGWHLPSDEEWTKLTDYLGGQFQAGGKLKSTSLWENPNEGATNESGFSGLPGGYCGSDGYFSLVGCVGYWWSSSEDNTDAARTRNLDCLAEDVSRHINLKSDGYSVRCLRD